MTTKLTPGTIVWHPDHGHGVVGYGPLGLVVHAINKDGRRVNFGDFDGWQPVSVARPGEVAVRVDDIADDLVRLWATHDASPDSGWPATSRLAIRAAKAIQAQRDQTTPQATPETLPTETTVRLACPNGCSEGIWTDAYVEDSNFGYHFVAVDGERHKCKPTIPDEPTEPGARWTLDGKRCVRDADPKGFPAWLDVDSVGNWHSWAGVTSHVEGWGE